MRQKSVIISWKWENLSRYDNARKSTTTEDQTGDILETRAVDKNDINEDTIDQVLQQFEGIFNKFRLCILLLK